MPELATIVRDYRDALEGHRGFLTTSERKILDDIQFCQADPDSVIRSYCSKCDKSHSMLASCKNRHCPKCQFPDGLVQKADRAAFACHLLYGNFHRAGAIAPHDAKQ